MAKENAFTGPFQHDLGQDLAGPISAALIALRDQLDEDGGPVLLEGQVVRAQSVPGQVVVREGEEIGLMAAPVGVFVYFKRGPGIVTQFLMDDLLGPTAFPGWPEVDGFLLVYEPEWWPIEHGNMAAFQVKRPSYGSSIGGDFVRGSSDPSALAALQHLPNAVLKFQTDDADKRSAVAGQALLYVQPSGYNTVRVEWDWPVEEGQLENWSEVALVRSQFGMPTTPNDGQTVFRSLREVWEDAEGNLMVGPVIFDNDLPGGNWFYYTLFFNISRYAPTLGDWVAGYSDSAQLPRHFQHDLHLFAGVPPYYQWIDENNKRKDGHGFLQQFMNIFGFELDYTRQSVEFMQDMYHTDITPIPLLRELGKNLGAEEEQGLGDIRFRAMMSDLAQRLNIRGTQKGLQQTIETMSKYDTDITVGKNLMLLPDDSAPQFSTGNWAGPHPDLLGLPDVVPWDQVVLETLPPDAEIQDVGILGFMRITSEHASDLLVTCGCGWIDPPALALPPGTRNQPGEYLPLTNGIPVEETGVYGFTAYLRTDVTTQEPKLAMLWFGESGLPDALLDVTIGTPPPGGTTTQWEAKHIIQGIAPEGAVYLVPAIYITNRADSYVDMTAAMVYLIQEAGSGITVTPPDQLLSLGDPNETMGEPPDPNDPTFLGYVMGAPVKKDNRSVPK